MASKRMKHPQLSRGPQDITKEAWYYEYPNGIHVVVEVRDTDGGYMTGRQILIPWKRLVSSVNRYKNRRASLNKRKASKARKGGGKK